MDDKDRTPEDLLGGLLGKPQKKVSEPVQESSRATEKPQEPQRKAKPAVAKENASQPVQESPEGQKSKATYYLDKDLLDQLDEGWIELRKMAKNKRQVSKSWIVEQALKLTLEELKSKGSKSKIAKSIKNNK